MATCHFPSSQSISQSVSPWCLVFGPATLSSQKGTHACRYPSIHSGYEKMAKCQPPRRHSFTMFGRMESFSSERINKTKWTNTLMQNIYWTISNYVLQVIWTELDWWCSGPNRHWLTDWLTWKTACLSGRIKRVHQFLSSCLGTSSIPCLLSIPNTALICGSQVVNVVGGWLVGWLSDADENAI